MKLCTHCDTTKSKNEFYKQSKPDKDWNCRDSMCKPCRSTYSSKRRRDIKIVAVEYKGGKCLDCNKTYPPEVYDFHHRDPNKKDFSVGQNSKSFKSIKKELNKCDLLCSNCHRIRHYSML